MKDDIEKHELIALAERHLGKAALLEGLDNYYDPKEGCEKSFQEAQRHYMNSLSKRQELKETQDQREEIADLYLDFGRLYWLQGRWWYKKATDNKCDSKMLEEAFHLCEKSISETDQALALFKNTGCARGVAKAWGNQGNATLEIAKCTLLRKCKVRDANKYLERAKEYYEKNLADAEVIDRDDEKAHALRGLAEVYCMIPTQQLDLALNYAIQSHDLYLKLGGPKDIRWTQQLVKQIQNRMENLWQEHWSNDELIIRKALIDMDYWKGGVLPEPVYRKTGVAGKSRVWHLHIETPKGTVLGIIAKIDERKRFNDEWQAIETLRNLVTPIEVMLPVHENNRSHNVTIYNNAAQYVLAGHLWTLKQLLREQLFHSRNNCKDALEGLLDPLCLFYTSEPGGIRLSPKAGGTTWHDAFPQISHNLPEIREYSDIDYLKSLNPSLPNPYQSLENYLDDFCGRVLRSRIHGDLNLTNILVGLTGNYRPNKVFLIDLALSQDDAVTALDLARLECEFWHEVIASWEGNDRNNYTDNEWIRFFWKVRDCLDGRTRIGDVDPSIPSVMCNSLMWVNELRKQAMDVLKVGGKEYKMADYMTALYLTHMRSLAFKSVQESLMKCRIATLGASLALKYLEVLRSGQNPSLPIAR